MLLLFDIILTLFSAEYNSILKREDYRGFDVIETYVEMVSGLKSLGF